MCLETVSSFAWVDYTQVQTHLLADELFVGDGTRALLLHPDENEDEDVAAQLHESVCAFHMAFVQKLLKAFNFKSTTLQLLKVLCPTAAQEAPLTMDKSSQTFAIQYDVQKVQMELREFRLDSVHVEGEDAETFWLRVRSMKSPLGKSKYLNLAVLAGCFSSPTPRHSGVKCQQRACFQPCAADTDRVPLTDESRHTLPLFHAT